MKKCCSESRVHLTLITRGICFILPNWTMHSSRIILFRNVEICNFLNNFKSFFYSKILQHRKLTLMDIISKISKYFRCFNWSILLFKASFLKTFSLFISKLNFITILRTPYYCAGHGFKSLESTCTCTLSYNACILTSQMVFKQFLYIFFIWM